MVEDVAKTHQAYEALSLTFELIARYITTTLLSETIHAAYYFDQTKANINESAHIQVSFPFRWRHKVIPLKLSS